MKNYSQKKVLIFSDTHLTDVFDKEWFDSVSPLIQQSDKVILNGDFWEHISCSFEKFTQSEWKDTLFPLLKEKGSVLIHGNHDPKRLMGWEGIQLFAQERHEDFVFKSGEKIFKVEHGDNVVPEFDSHHRITTKFVEKHLPFFYVWMTKFEDKENFLSRWLRRYLEKERKKETEEYKEFSVNNKEDKTIRIFGHVHTPKHDICDDFVVLGSYKNGNQRYIQIENGEIDFVNTKYNIKK